MLVGGVALLALLVSARATVGRLVAVARYYEISDAVVGLTVVAIGTSLPEIASNFIASVGIVAGTLDYGVASATVLGGSLGSSMTQGTLLVGAFLLGAGRVTLSRSFVRASYVPMVLAVGLTLALAVDGTVSRVDGLVLLGAFVVYLYYTFDRRERVIVAESVEAEVSTVNVRANALVAVVGILTVLASAYLVVAAIEVLVAELQLGGSTIGVVTLGVASALPELSTVAESIRRRTPTLALGTLVGSNVVNPLFGIGLGGAISTYRVPAPVVRWDLPFTLVVGVAVVGYVTWVSDGDLRRRDATAFVGAYFAFVAGRLLLFPGQ